jgi:hypothetical protein
MMDRRSFLAGLTAPAVLAFAAKAQSAGRLETLRVAPEEEYLKGHYGRA